MNGRKLYREYAKSKGLDCKEFVSVKDDYDGYQILEYKDSNGVTQKTSISVTNMLHWIINSFGNGAWEHFESKSNT